MEGINLLDMPSQVESLAEFESDVILLLLLLLFGNDGDDTINGPAMEFRS